MSITRNGRIASFAAAALVLAACESQPTAAPAGASFTDGDRVAQSTPLDVQEAALRWLIDNKSATGLDAQCVSTGYPNATNDPSSLLLHRFAGSTPPLVPISDCTVEVGGITYNPTGGPAQWFKLGDPVITGRTATIETAMQLHGRLFEAYACQARLRNVWTITGCDLVAAG